VQRFTANDLEQLATAILAFHGVTEADAIETARCLVFADRSELPGHGLLRLKQYLDRIRAGGCNPRPRMITREHGATCVIDGDNALGPAAAALGMRWAIAAAGKSGVAVAVVRDANHFGAASYYARLASDHRMIGIAISNVLAAMPAAGGTAPVVGNNAIAFAFPQTTGEPVVFDACCSKSSLGVLMSAMRDGKPLPEGCFLDRHGQPTLDPDAGRLSNGGMHVPMGEHKGFGFALAMSLLTGALGGWLVDPEIKNPFANPGERGGNSFFMLALDVAAFVPVTTFTEKTEVITALARATAAPGAQTRLPGDRAAAARTRSEQGIALSDATAKELRVLADAAGVGFPQPA
jgi:LDH2 family malate/lactate/ureidoglycolate dehydrogenase